MAGERIGLRLDLAMAARMVAPPSRETPFVTEMPALTVAAIAFPHINPVIVSIGPFSIHWYGVGYVVGILFGWWYSKRLVSTPRLWRNEQTADEAGRPRRFRPVGGHWHRGRGTHRLRALLRPASLRCPSPRHLRALAWRDVFPRRSSGHHPRHGALRPLALDQCLEHARYRRSRRSCRPRPRALRQLHQFANSGARSPTCPGA